MRRINFLLPVFLATVTCICASDPPSGFTGVRGKKSISDSAYSEPTQTVEEVNSGQAEIVNGRDATSNVISGPVLDKRAPSGFMGMRGKKPIDEWVAANQPEYSMGYFKRAPSGFLGMRGKKENFYGKLLFYFSIFFYPKDVIHIGIPTNISVKIFGGPLGKW